jgi:hypothetical protein
LNKTLYKVLSDAQLPIWETWVKYVTITFLLGFGGEDFGYEGNNFIW